MKIKKAFITGIAGQDGSYLAELLLDLGYEVHGCVRRSSVSENQTYRINHIIDKLHMHHADITDFGSIARLFKEIQPDEIYHLAAMSHVKVSFYEPNFTIRNNTLGTLNILEAAKLFCPEAKIYNASSSEMFGNETSWDYIDEKNTITYQDEDTSMIPVSPYGISKLGAHNLAIQYRTQGMFVSNGILFNHESPRRGLAFVTRKIVKGAVDIKLGKQNKLVLGNLNAYRDWGYAQEYVEAMHMMLQDDIANDYVIATEESYTIKDAVDYIFNEFKLDTNRIEISDKYKRPIEVNYLKGKMDKYYNRFMWKPTIKFHDLLDIMIKAEYDSAK